MKKIILALLFISSIAYGAKNIVVDKKYGYISGELTKTDGDINTDPIINIYCKGRVIKGANSKDFEVVVSTLAIPDDITVKKYEFSADKKSIKEVKTSSVAVAIGIEE